MWEEGNFGCIPGLCRRAAPSLEAPTVLQVIPPRRRCVAHDLAYHGHEHTELANWNTEAGAGGARTLCATEC